MTDHVAIAVADGVMTITLRRPDKKNAMTVAMYAALCEAMAKAEADPAVKVVLFEADGDSFCAGNDLADFLKAAGNRDALPATGFIQSLVDAAKPLVAAVQGVAVGIGATMLLHCDLVYLADNARLVAPFVPLGIAPEAGSSLLLAPRIGHSRAFAMFALGEPLDAASAVSFGLANAVLPTGEYRAVAREAAHKLAKAAPGALRDTKRLMRRAGMLSEVVAQENAILEVRVRSANAQEAITAFGEKRAPVFIED